MRVRSIDDLGFSAIVPGNSSRFFGTQKEAREQPLGSVRLAWDPADPYVRNIDSRQAIIKYDDRYCTSVASLAEDIVLPTMDYFVEEVLPHLTSEPRIVDIGCGQGEFVDALRAIGLEAVGYDPVCRSEKVREGYLHAAYWQPNEVAADLYVMRCVLPHLPRPWAFIEAIQQSSAGSYVLIEFQRLEWIIDYQVWQQICHDHVNLFRSQDFHARYDVVAEGIFSEGEWGWVLIRVASQRAPSPAQPGRLGVNLRELHRSRRDFAQSVQRDSPSVVVWGAAAKGIVLSFALSRAGASVIAVDADPIRWGKHLEGSGALVISPREVMQSKQLLAKPILVSNPRHLQDVQELLSATTKVSTVPMFLTDEGHM